MTQTQVSAIFPAHPIYRWLALLCLGVACLLLWELRHGLGWGPALGGGLALVTAVYYGRLALCRVELSAPQVRLVAPAAPPQSIELRQVAEVHSEGRIIPALLVVYHPRRADGLFDHEELRTLNLPAVARQDALWAALGGAPKGYA